MLRIGLADIKQRELGEVVVCQNQIQCFEKLPIRLRVVAGLPWPRIGKLVGAQAWPEAASLFDGYILAITAWLAFVSAAAFALWNWLSTLFPVHLLATYRFMIPLCGMVESLLLIEGERVTPLMGAGAILVVAAMVAAQRTGRPAVST